MILNSILFLSLFVTSSPMSKDTNDDTLSRRMYLPNPLGIPPTPIIPSGATTRQVSRITDARLEKAKNDQLKTRRILDLLNKKNRDLETELTHHLEHQDQVTKRIDRVVQGIDRPKSYSNPKLPRDHRTKTSFKKDSKKRAVKKPTVQNIVGSPDSIFSFDQEYNQRHDRTVEPEPHQSGNSSGGVLEWVASKVRQSGTCLRGICRRRRRPEHSPSNSGSGSGEEIKGDSPSITKHHHSLIPDKQETPVKANSRVMHQHSMDVNKEENVVYSRV